MEYPVRIVAIGKFQEGDIEVLQEELPPLPADVAEKVEAIWAKELERNPHLTPGPLLVGRSVETFDDGKKLRLSCGVSDYKKFMGTTHETVAPNFPEDYWHRAIGFLSVTITHDGYVLFGVRSPQIDWGLLRHVVPAGRLRPDETDPFTGVRKEYTQELGLLPEEIRDLVCVGVVADQTWGRLNYEFCFMAKTTLSAREVIERSRSAASAHEHCQLEPFRWSPALCPGLLLADPDGYVPTGWAAVALSLREEYDSFPIPDWTPVHRTYEQHMGRRLEMLRK